MGKIFIWLVKSILWLIPAAMAFLIMEPVALKADAPQKPRSATQITTMFDFDTGTPALVEMMGMPATQTKLGVTANFSVPTGSGAFSIQSDASTHYSLSQFSGKYLMPNGLGPNVLDIRFSHPALSLNFTFATADFHQTELTTDVLLTAYNDSVTTTPVGTKVARGVYGSTTMPMGQLSFDSGGKPFNLVRIQIRPGQPLGSSVFLIDNIQAVVTEPPPSAARSCWSLYE